MREFFLAIKYARRELRAGLKGFYVFLACLVLGTASIAGVQSLSAGLIESLRHDGRFILGGDISLRTVYAPASPEQIDFLQRKIGPVNTVMETRAMAQTDAGKSALVELKAVDPFYPLYGRMEFADGEGRSLGSDTQSFLLPHGAENFEKDIGWGVVVEKELLPRLGVKVGDEITLGSRKFRINGVILKEPDRIGALRFTIAPRVMISSAVFKDTGLAGVGMQVYYDHRVVTPYIRSYGDMQAVMKKIEDAFPKAQWRGRTCFNAAPRVEERIKQLTQFLTLIALTSMLVGGVGISNAVRSFLDSKLANIATLKCLGARGAFVTKVYMTMILMLAALGTLIGLGIGAGGARLGGMLLTAKLSLTDQVGFYPSALFLAAGFGMLTSVCFSLWPVAKAALAPPNDLFRDAVQPAAGRPPFRTLLSVLVAALALALLAILSAEDTRLAVWFIAGAAVVFTVFFLYAGAVRALLRRLKAPGSPALRMAISNLHRPGNSTGGIILSLGLGLTVLVATALAQDNFSRLLSDGLAGDAPSFFFVDVQPDQKADFEAFIAAWPTARGLVMAPSFRGRIIAANGVDAEQALVDKNESWVIRSDRGFTWTKSLPAHSTITQGQWWPADYAGPPIISISTDVARAFAIGVGDSLTLGIYGTEVTAKVANVREVEWSSFTMNFAVTFAPGLIEKAPANFMATAILDEDKEAALQDALVQKFPNVTAVRVRDALAAAQTMMRAVAQAVKISAGVTILGGVLVLGGAVAAARRRHVYDSVILKVLGAGRARILKTLLLEYAVLGIVTALIAAFFGTITAYGAVAFIMGLGWELSWGALVFITLASLGITVGAGFLGTFRALWQRPALYLRNQ